MRYLRIIKTVFTAISLALLINTFTSGQQPVYLDLKQPVDKRVEDLLSRMTLEEKVGQLNVPAPGRMARDSAGRVNACKSFTEGKLVPNIGPAGGFFAAASMFRGGARQQATFLNELQKIATEKHG
jgi:hypothetical protein